MFKTHISPFILLIICFFAVSLSFAQEGDAALGEKIFKNNCAACHAYDNNVIVGPGLQGIEERRDYDWIKAWINNPAAVIASGDEYAINLY
ncbi:MAG: mono/diheme cytochrome c family protein, partial [Algoriphagus sp.]